MKEFKIVQTALGTVLMASLAMMVSCNKDDDSVKSYRVKSWQAYKDGILVTETNLKYDGNRISRAEIFDSDEGTDSVRKMIAYPDRYSATVVDYGLQGGGANDTLREDLQIDNGRVSMSTFFKRIAGEWYADERIVLDYDNDRVISEFRSYYLNEAWRNYLCYSYSYSGDHIDYITVYISQDGSSFTEMAREFWTYEGDRLVNTTVSFPAGGGYNPASMVSYQYSGDRLDQLFLFIYVGGNWVQRGRPVNIYYDSNGNVTSWSDPDDLWTGSHEFTYEPGEGNYREIFAYSYTSFRDYFPMPTKAGGLNVK